MYTWTLHTSLALHFFGFISSVRRGYGVLNEDVLTINAGSFVHSMAFCHITSPAVKQHPSTSVRYHRIVTDDVVLVTGHSNGRMRAWDVKTGESCFFSLSCCVLYSCLSVVLSFLVVPMSHFVIFSTSRCILWHSAEHFSFSLYCFLDLSCSRS